MNSLRCFLLLMIMTSFYNCERKATSSMKDKSPEISSEKIEALLTQMTLKEKLSLIHASSSFTSGGIPRLNIPEISMSDGPHGVRYEHGRGWSRLENADDQATYLPTGITLASTWNKSLGLQYGRVLGSEAKERNKNIILGPGINIIRSPLNGRNFEYLSEDPYLTAQMAIGYVNGVQEHGVAACAKHFVANNQETNRSNVDALVSNRALHEIYLPAFKTVVQDAHVWSIMGSYNKVNGQFATHHEYLVNSILKNDWGFDGVLISDWASVKDTKEALLYGTDIEMGTELVKSFNNPDYDGFYLANPAEKMIESGEVEESVVDDKVRRILKLMMRSTVLTDYGQGERNTEEHQKTALQVAQEGIILLKNEQILPIISAEKKTIAVIGHNAIRKFASRGGSSQVNALYEISALEGIQKIAGDKYEIVFSEGYEPYFDENDFRKENVQTAAQTKVNNVKVAASKKSNQKLIQDAVAIAKKADYVIFVGGWIHGFDGYAWGEGTFDSEARDKVNLKLTFGQEELLQELTTVNRNVISVIYGGSQVEMKNWLPNVKAYIHAWYPGMEGGTALAQILFGDVNPSGKLPVTFANSHMDYPSHSIGEFPGGDEVKYTEDIFVGYRYFASKNISVPFAFGHGLSYTSFAFSNMVTSTGDNDNEIRVTCEVTNTGDMAGYEVAQLYMSQNKPSVVRPKIELKEFSKVWLEPKETKKIEFVLHKDAFKYFDSNTNTWTLEKDMYTLLLGNSSVNTPLQKSIKI
jgi:beta-glucosidase